MFSNRTLITSALLASLTAVAARPALAQTSGKPNPATASAPVTPANPAAPPAMRRMPPPLVVVPPSVPNPKAEAAAVAALTKASNAFAVDLWKTQRATAGNLAMSPTSITAALVMTWGGAKGKTAAQMRKAMHLQGDEASVFTGWRGLSTSLQAPSRKLKLRMANRLFGEQTFGFEQPFLDKTAASFGAPLEKVDFVGKPDAQRLRINEWVATQTESRIKDLLAPGILSADTRLVLVNAIYFLAEWATPFTRERTRDAAFNVTPTAPKNVATMQQVGTFRTAKSGKAAVLELPYQGDDTAMWIVLPDANNNLAAVEAGLSAKQMATWSRDLKAQELDVYLPKFEVNPTAALLLNPALEKLGMTDAFSDKRANFAGMAAPTDATKRLYISSVVHKAFVKVDEKGTEAAAATAVVMTTGGAMPLPSTAFRVDRPFLFMIVDKKTGLLLFMGRVVDPSQK